MLRLDLGRLQREQRVDVEADIAPDDSIWQRADLPLAGALEVRLRAQPAGHDVLVRGTLSGEVGLTCRRCLEPVRVRLEEPVSFLFRPGLTELEAEDEEVYTFAAQAREIDLVGPVREHVLLSAPSYALCREACRGLCPRCGANLNGGSCHCVSAEVDERWAALRKLTLD